MSYCRGGAFSDASLSSLLLLVSRSAAPLEVTLRKSRAWMTRKFRSIAISILCDVAEVTDVSDNEDNAGQRAGRSSYAARASRKRTRQQAQCGTRAPQEDRPNLFSND